MNDEDLTKIWFEKVVQGEYRNPWKLGAEKLLQYHRQWAFEYYSSKLDEAMGYLNEISTRPSPRGLRYRVELRSRLHRLRRDVALLQVVEFETWVLVVQDIEDQWKEIDTLLCHLKNNLEKGERNVA